MVFFLPFSVWAQWQTITPFGGDVNDVYFLNARDGIAVGQQAGIGSCSGPCFISRTIDGGENWIRLFPSGLSTTSLNAVDFSGNTGLACGSSSVILKTTDAGYTWTQATAGVGSGYNDLAFTGPNSAVVIGNNGLIRYSSNAGTSWSTVASGVTGTLNSISFPGNGVVFIGGSNGTLLKSTNSGSSWTLVNTGLSNPLFRICFSTPQLGFFAGGNTIYKTTNGGTSWSQQSLSMNGFIRKIRFLNPQQGYFVTDAGEWAVTSDSGTTWAIQPTGYVQPLYSFRFIDPMTVVACGDEGLLIRSDDGGQTWHSQLSGITDEQFGLVIQDTSVVWSCGKDGSVFRSRNAGFNWQRIKTGTNATFLNLCRISSSKVLLCADSGRVFIGNNQSFDLEVVQVDTSQAIKDAWFIDSLRGWACTAGDRIYRTLNGGYTWSFITQVGVGESLRAIQFINSNTGFTIGNFGVYKTTSAGFLWTYTPFLNASFLDDIRFYGDSIGYCAGSFGRMMKTENQGNTWFETDSTFTGNLNISSISLINDSTLYVASGQSQKLSIDGGEVFGSQSTACLANNWSTNAIDVLAPDTLGFCTGGLTGLMHKLSYSELNAVSTDRTAYCSNQAIEVFFRGSGLAFSTWIFEIQLSDAQGNFSNAIPIGSASFNQLSYLVSGLVRCPIPVGTPPGFGYRIRVVCANPALVSPDNGYNIAISNSLTPSVSLSGDLQGCAGEPLLYNAQDFAGGSNPQWNWYLNDSLVQQGGTQFLLLSPQSGDSLYVRMQTSLSCATAALAFSDTLVPDISIRPLLTAGNDTAVCAGSVIQLNVQSTQPVQWFPQGILNNDTISNPVLTATQPIVFTVRSGQPGCESSDTVDVAVFSLPQPSIGGLSPLCPGACLQVIPASVDSTAGFNWTPSGLFSNPTVPDPVLCPTGDSWIFLLVTDSNNCVGADSSFVMVYPTPLSPVIIQQGDTLQTSGFSTYQWLQNGIPLSGATDSMYVVQQSSTYSVIGTDGNGCTAESDSVLVLITELIAPVSGGYTLAPVPVQDLLHINALSSTEVSTLLVYSGSGALVTMHRGLFTPATIDLGNLPDGLYFLEMHTPSGIVRRKFTKSIR